VTNDEGRATTDDRRQTASSTPVITAARNLALAGMVSQIGCVTVVIVVGALLVGLWLDARLDTRPVMTVVMLLLSIPVSLYSLVRIALATAAQFRVMNDEGQTTQDERRRTDDDKG
jgi:F0F1-type ATP synthase assembly protein I